MDSDDKMPKKAFGWATETGRAGPFLSCVRNLQGHFSQFHRSVLDSAKELFYFYRAEK
jgi:hypothetical protein